MRQMPAATHQLFDRMSLRMNAEQQATSLMPDAFEQWAERYIDERIAKGISDCKADFTYEEWVLSRAAWNAAIASTDAQVESGRIDAEQRGAVWANEAELVEQQSGLPLSVDAAIATAYGYLWHVNNEPGTPRQYPPERAAYEARKALRDLLTKEQRGRAINAVRAAMAADEQGKSP